jgi:hypothetical protein
MPEDTTDPKEELRRIQTQIEQSEMNLDAMKKRKDKLSTDITEMDKSENQNKPIVEKYKKEYERIKNDQSDIEGDYNRWKPLVIGNKSIVEPVRKDVDGQIEFLEKKIKGLQCDWISPSDCLPIFTWENIKNEPFKTSENEPIFCWDDIPGNDEDKFIQFLKQNYGTDWLGKGFQKSESNKTISISVENDRKTNSLSLSLNEEETKVTLTIDCIRKDEFIVQEVSGKKNIYQIDIDKLKDFLRMNYNINLDWVKNSVTEISSDGKTIKISDPDEHSLSLKLIEKNNKVYLDLKDGRTGEFSATLNVKNNKHDVYYKSKKSVEEEYNAAKKDKEVKEKAYGELKDLLTSIDDTIKKGKASYKSIDDENKKEEKEINNKIMCFYTWEMKDVKDKLMCLIQKKDNYEPNLTDSHKELKDSKEVLRIKESLLNDLNVELAAAQKKLDALKKSRDKDIIDRLPKEELPTE